MKVHELQRHVRRRRAGGLTLIEVLLVLLILMMLAGAMIIFVLPQQEGAQRNTTMIKLRQIDSALQQYSLQVGSFPTEEQGGLQALIRRPQFENETLRNRWQGPYLDPNAELVDAWGHPLRYELLDTTMMDDDGTGLRYRLYSVGRDGQPDTDDDIHLRREREDF